MKSRAVLIFVVMTIFFSCCSRKESELRSILFDGPVFVELSAARNNFRVSWDPVTKDVDGATADDIAGYWVIVIDASGGETKFDCGLSTVFEIELNSDPGWRFAVSAYDLLGNEGPRSDFVSAREKN